MTYVSFLHHFSYVARGHSLTGLVRLYHIPIGSRFNFCYQLASEKKVAKLKNYL
jgi:hypothetical protein